MAQIQSLAASMFGGASGPQSPSAPPAVPAAPPAPSVNNPQSSGGFSPEMLSMMTRLAPMLQNMRRETPYTQLLGALRPLLSLPGQKKLDEALKLIQLMSVLPMLRSTGLLKGLL